MNIRKGLGAVCCTVLMLASSVVLAAAPAATREQVEASMLVTGTIQLDTAGKVSGFSLDKKEKLPAGIVNLLDKFVPQWVFEPELVDGKPVNVSTDMSIRLVAKKVDEENFSLRIRSAAFGDRTGKREETVRALKRTPPSYPTDLASAGVAGTVYLLVRVGRDGKVTDVIAEQVNLKAVAGEGTMTRWRDAFANVSVKKARSWTFIPPTEGQDASKGFWVMRVPVVFSLDMPSRAKVAYGKWDAYVPGPRQPNPWDADDAEGAAFSPDALPPGNDYLAGSGLRLLTALSDG